MFHSITTVETLEQFIDTADAIVDESRIHLHPNMLRLSAVGPANVGMVEQSLGAKAFESFEADEGVIGVELDRFADVLGMGSSDDLVQLELNADTRTLDFELDGYSYELATIDADAIRAEPNIPNFGHAGEAVITGRDLDRLAKGADLVSDCITLGFDADDGVLYADADGDVDTARLELDGDDLIDGKFERSAESMFSVDYIKQVAKTAAADAEVTVGLGSEMPIEFRYQYADGAGNVKQYVAPRIESD